MSNATDKWYLSGALGIGTDNPEKMLHIQGSSTAPLLNDSHDRPGLPITGSYPELDLFSEANNPKHGPTIRLGSYNSDKKDSFKQWVIGTCGRDSTFLDIGFSDKNDPNPHAGIRNHNGQTCLTIHQDGNVGIGTTTPTARLEVMETFFPFPFVGGPILQPVLGTQSVLRDSKAEISLSITTGLRLFSQYNPKETCGGVINSCDADGTVRPLTLQLNRGNVGIGITDTKRNLHVEGNEIHSGGPSGGFSFSNRGTGFVEVPSNGERWVWYSHENKARLWSGTDKLSISKEGKLEVNGELTALGNVGIGTANPTYPIHVKTNWGFLALDSNAAGQDSGLQLMEGGAVKWHIWNSAKDAIFKIVRDGLPAASLTIDQSGNVDIGANPIRFSSSWTASPDGVRNRAEISNDTGDFKTLMIVGNNSAGVERRVSIWDRLEVNGTFAIIKFISNDNEARRILSTLPSNSVIIGIEPVTVGLGGQKGALMFYWKSENGTMNKNWLNAHGI